jgi:putative ABC transport system permease protein
MILTSFAVLGILLAVIGIYGVISYLVVQRTQEFGIRLALGAMRSDVLWLIVRQGLLLGLFGIGIGIVGIALISRLLSSLLYGISALDAITLALASILLLLVAALASAIPARRAMQINPVQALRTE